MLTNDQVQKTVSNFELASKEFGFGFCSPFVLSDDLVAFGYIDNYGSKNGVVICLTCPPDFEADRRIVQWCAENDCFYTFLNVELLTGEYNRSYFKKLLRDLEKF